MKKKINFFNIFVIVSIVFLAIMITPKVFQNDTFYTIRVGESILENGIDMKEHFSYIEGLEYTYPHALYDVFIFILYNYFGFTGIYVSTIALAALLLGIMYKTVNNLISNKGLSYLLVLFIGLTLRDFMAARAQLVSYILFLIIIYFLEKIRGNFKKRYIVYILITAILIANVHAAVWPFIFVLFMPYLGSDLVYYIKSKFKNKIDNYKKEKKLRGSIIEVEEPKNTKALIITFILTIFTGFLTPNRFVPFTYFIKTKMGITMSYISEHLPVSIDRRPALFIIIAILIFVLLQSNMKIKLKDLFFIGGLSLLAFLSRRSYALFVILSIYSFARIFSCFLDKRMTKYSLEDILSIPALYLPVTILLGSSAFIMFRNDYKKDYVNETKYPVELSEYILKEYDINSIRIYNEYNFGSYLLYKGIPVFIDSRADLYTEEFNPSCEIFKDGVNLFRNYREVFDKYDITHVIVYNTNKLNLVLSLDDNYSLRYKDKYFSMYEKLT